MPTLANNITRRKELARQLETSADRIIDYQERLRAGISTLKPIEFDRLVDDYHNEQHRYDRLDRELTTLEEPTKAAAAKERWYRLNKQNRTKIKY